MTVCKPKFIDSRYFVIGKGITAWRIKEGAPKEIIKEFKDFKKRVSSPTLNPYDHLMND